MDINGGAASIECYLDLKTAKTPEAMVRWTGYIKYVASYQGALDHETKFMKAFMNLRSETLGESNYDTSKMISVLDMLYHECVSTSIAQRPGQSSE